ncbi:MAG: cysteine-rich CWC family protein [Flavobacterium sp.]
MNTIQVKHCSSCGTAFDCAAFSSEKKCWCYDFPPLFDFSEAEDCLCATCLKKSCLLKIEQYENTIAPESALKNTVQNLPKTSPLIEDIDYYLENGNYVYKAWFHLKRGSCCGSACRHCPY